MGRFTLVIRSLLAFSNRPWEAQTFEVGNLFEIALWTVERLSDPCKASLYTNGCYLPRWSQRHGMVAWRMCCFISFESCIISVDFKEGMPN